MHGNYVANLFITGCQSGNDVAASEITLRLHQYSQHGAAGSRLSTMLLRSVCLRPVHLIRKWPWEGELGAASALGF